MSDFFKYCHWENDVFKDGLFWLIIFVITSVWTLYFKIQEASEAQIEQILKDKESASNLKPVAEVQEQDSGSASPVKITSDKDKQEQKTSKQQERKPAKKDKPVEPQEASEKRRNVPDNSVTADGW